MSYDPWSAVIGQIVAGGARNMKESGQGAASSEKAGGGYGPQQGNMVYSHAPNMGNTAGSPTEQLSTFATGISGAQQEQIPVVGDALRGEKETLRNVTPAQSGFVQMPTTVDSSKQIGQAFNSSNPWANIYAQYARY